MNRFTQWLRALLLLAAVLGGAISGAAREVPYLGGRVNDLAGLVEASTAQALEERLAALEETTGAQVAVLTIPSLEGEILEEYSLRVAETWKLGREEFDNGALLLIARDDRKMRLEVGYGLEGAIPDAYAKRILDDVVRPQFRAGDYDAGISEAVDVIARLVEGEEALPPPSETDAFPVMDFGWPTAIAFLMFLFVVGSFSIQALSTHGCMAWILYLFLMPFWATFPLAFLGRPLGLIPIALWVLGFPPLWLLIHKTGIGRNGGGGGPFIGTGGGWSSSGGGWGGGFSGGGFSGGGGSFGGGGASGSW